MGLDLVAWVALSISLALVILRGVRPMPLRTTAISSATYFAVLFVVSAVTPMLLGERWREIPADCIPCPPYVLTLAEYLAAVFWRLTRGSLATAVVMGAVLARALSSRWSRPGSMMALGGTVALFGEVLTRYPVSWPLVRDVFLDFGASDPLLRARWWRETAFLAVYLVTVPFLAGLLAGWALARLGPPSLPISVRHFTPRSLVSRA